MTNHMRCVGPEAVPGGRPRWAELALGIACLLTLAGPVSSAQEDKPVLPARVSPGSTEPSARPVASRAAAEVTRPPSDVSPVREEETDTLYSALILATNEARPADVPADLRPVVHQLSAFGYNQYRVLGDRKKVVSAGHKEEWMVPGRRFALRVDTRGRFAEGVYELGLQLFEDKRILVEADVRLHRHSPLFIRGPLAGTGQLIVLLLVI